MNQIPFQNAYQVSTTALMPIGQRAMTPDGREWVYVTNTTATLAAGNIVVPAAVVTSDLWSSSTDTQGRIVYLTRAANSFTVGAYAGGVGTVDQGTGVGQQFKILTNNVTTLTLSPETALATALAVADSDLTFMPNMAKVVVAAVTSKVQMVQGSVQVASVTGDYLWALTEGVGKAVAGEVLVVGADFVSGDDTVGQVLKGTTAKGGFDEQNLGFCVIANDAADQGTLVQFEIRG